MATLKFGKFKGQEFSQTPTWYQEWLIKQDWFKIPTKQISNLSYAEKSFSNAHNYAKSSNYSERSIDAMFEAEQMLDDAVEYERKYYGMDAETKQAQMDWDYEEIVACNQVYDYYNN
jgi:hypothetical protein